MAEVRTYDTVVWRFFAEKFTETLALVGVVRGLLDINHVLVALVCELLDHIPNCIVIGYLAVILSIDTPVSDVEGDNGI